MAINLVVAQFSKLVPLYIAILNGSNAFEKYNLMNSEIFLPCSFSFEKINALLAQQLSGMVVNEKLTIVSTKLSGEDRQIFIRTIVSGVFDGPVYISFIPTYDSAEDKFILDELEVSVGEGGLLAKGANFVLNKVFGGKLDAKFEEIINAKFLDLKNEWLEKLKSMNFGPGFTSHMDISEFDLREIHEHEGNLKFNVIIKGAAKLEM